MKKRHFLIIIESFVVVLCLLGNIVCGKGLPVYSSEVEELKQLEAERQQAVYEYDRNMLDEYTAIKDEIALKETLLEAELHNLELMQKELTAQKENLNSIINQKKGELTVKAGRNYRKGRFNRVFQWESFTFWSHTKWNLCRSIGVC